MALTKIGKEGITGINNSSNATAITIDSSENVGIGTSSPSSVLHTYKNNTNAYNLFQGNAGSWVFGQADGKCQVGGLLGTHSGMVVDTSGNVGIGTASPTLDGSLAGLSVNGSGTVLHVNDGEGATLKLTDPAAGSNRGLGISLQNTEAVISNCESGSLRFGTGNAERMRIDSSGNLLVGTTDSSPENNSTGTSADNGLALTPYGYGSFSRYAANSGTGIPLFVNRTNADGVLVQFRKDGGTVGSIGVASSDLTIFSTTGNHKGLRFGNAQIVPTNNAGADSDNTTDLGGASNRFKDLYLSGGVYLGGTGSANKLDDYEEGTWIPTITSGSSVFTYTNQVGVYTKIGNLVYATFDISYSSFTSPNGSTTYIELPAINASSSAVYHMAQLRGARCTGLTTAVTAHDGSHAIISGTSKFEINKNDGSGNSGVISSNNGLNSSGRIVGTAIYSTS